MVREEAYVQLRADMVDTPTLHAGAAAGNATTSSYFTIPLYQHTVSDIVTHASNLTYLCISMIDHLANVTSMIYLTHLCISGISTLCL